MKPELHIHACIQQILRDHGWDTPRPTPGGYVCARGTFRCQHGGLLGDAPGRLAQENLWVHLMVWTGLREAWPLLVK